ncbi:MAG TPA: phosphoenolpyruvate--protein phosphotransferase, partial [Cyanobacteria bacterium UBA11370]|nr:phosphoenolpyruvate--protein phosphotransferase [Cyanobacteria bacterium UBA11370]
PTNHPLHPLPNPLPHPLPTLSGIPTSPGIAIGPATLYQPKLPELPEPLLDDPKRSWQELQTAIKTAQNQIQTLHQKVATSEEAAIFDAHLLILQDPTLLEATHQQIFEHSLCAAAAWHTVIEQTVNTYKKLDDPYLKARAVDVSDVGQRVLRLLTGIVAVLPDMQEPGILIATDLTPSSTVELDPNKVLGICTVAGSAMSHAAILARSLGIPAVMGVGNELLHVENGTLLALDGETGNVWIEPDEAHLKELQIKRDSKLNTIQASRPNAHESAKTKDGHSVKIMANIGGLSDVEIALKNGAEGVGLLRSEFIYLQRTSLPTEDELLEVYQAIAQSLSPHPLIIRILDIGGDKPLPYLNLEPETNPFLGWRGIRLLLDYPELLKTQLRAILRASYGYSIKIMFPMIASVREIRAAKVVLSTVQTELRQAGIPFNGTMEVGIMIEVPSSVTIADQLATEVDFFSIGTNDLSQYSMAADRTNPKVASLADALEPAILRMIQQTIIAAHNVGIWVSVCGELASSSVATPILIGLGVDELSMNPLAIPGVKATISQFSMNEAEAIAHHVLQLDSAQSVREYVATKFS